MEPYGTQKDNSTTPPVILFDGVCPLCNRGVNFIFRIDEKGLLKAASFQSDYGRTALSMHRRQLDPPDSMMLLEGRRLSTKSTAVIRISKYMGSVWPLCMIMLIVPRFIRDFFYDLVAQNRYRQFGKYDACPLPAPEFKDRFYE